jgi:hypothetical protein
MEIKKGMFILIVGCALLACGEGKSGEAESKVDGLTGLGKKSESSEKGANTCLLGYADKLNLLLTKEMAMELAQLPADNMKEKYFTQLKNQEHHHIRYSWKSKRTKNLKGIGMDMDVPADDIIQLNGLKPMTEKYFKMSRSVPTEDQLAKMDQTLNDAFDRKSGNEAVNKRLDKLDSLKVNRETQKKVGKSMGGAFAKIAQAYSDVQGIGDVASWNSIENTLYVLDGGVEMSLQVELSSDHLQNKEKAIVLAGQLLKKCK